MLKKKLAHTIVEFITNTIHNIDFKLKHRVSDNNFERERKLPFSKMMLLLIKKSVKSLQLVLNELVLKLDIDDTVTASAFSQARRKLSHTAFIELSDGLISRYYERDESVKRWKGFRVSGVDGSKIRLPDGPETKEVFGTFKISCQKELDREYPSALASVCYDVLNHIAISAELAPAKAYEVDVAKKHFSHLGSQDLLIFDRGYASFYMMACLTQADLNFVIRCPKSFLKESNEMFKVDGPSSKVVTINVPKNQRKNIIEENLLTQLKVRFVRVILATGEIEVLVTSLLDEGKYLTAEFKELYWLRWGVETFYGTLKGRLNLDNFTGKSAEAVKQDFYSTIFLSNLETIITEEAQESIKEKSQGSMYPKAVNKAVSFNAIKNYAFELFYERGDIGDKLKKLTRLFLLNPSITRKERIVPRKKKILENL